MKILLVTEYFYPNEFGGGEKSAFLLAKILSKKNDVSVLTSRFKGEKEYEETEGIKIHRRFKTGSPNSLIGNLKRIIIFFHSAKYELKKILQEQTFDVIHCPNQTSGILLKALAKTANTKNVVATINGVTALCPKGNLLYKEKFECSGGNFFKCMNCIMQSKYVGNIHWPFFLKYNPLAFLALYFNYMWRKKALQKIHKLIVYSEHIKNILIRHKISKECIEKIPALIELKKDEKIIPEIDGFKRKLIISSLSALHKLKGVDLIIKAFAKLKNKNIVLIIAGDGPEKSNLEDLAKELNVHDKTLFLGKLDKERVNYLYKTSSIIVFTSLLPEAFSRICLESAFFGIPVIATAVGGSKDYIVEGENGFLIPPDENILKQKIEILVKNEKLRNHMAKKTKEIYKEKYDPNIIIGKIMKVYEA